MPLPVAVSPALPSAHEVGWSRPACRPRSRGWRVESRGQTAGRTPGRDFCRHNSFFCGKRQPSVVQPRLSRRVPPSYSPRDSASRRAHWSWVSAAATRRLHRRTETRVRSMLWLPRPSPATHETAAVGIYGCGWTPPRREWFYSASRTGWRVRKVRARSCGGRSPSLPRTHSSAGIRRSTRAPGSVTRSPHTKPREEVPHREGNRSLRSVTDRRRDKQPFITII